MVRHLLKMSSTALRYIRSIVMPDSRPNGEPHVYNPTTTTEEPEEKEEETETKRLTLAEIFVVPTEILSRRRCVIKVAEVLMAFVTFVLEEIVTTCNNCLPLYFFEFVSCSAFLFTLLLLICLGTILHTKVKMTVNIWAKVDFGYTLGMAVMLLSVSLWFAIQNEGSVMEHAAAAFGFLSAVVFLVDFVVLVRTPDHPWRKWDEKVVVEEEEKEEKDDDEEAAEGAGAEAETEMQRLNPVPMNGIGGE